MIFPFLHQPIQCDPHFHIPNSIVFWSNATFIAAICPDPTVPHGSVVLIHPNSTNGTYAVGTQVWFDCDEGFQYYRRQVILYSEADGTWSGRQICAGNNKKMWELQTFARERNG